MFSLFKKKLTQAASQANAEVKKVENRDFMEAAIGVMVLVAAADGEIEPSELQKLQKTIETLPELQGFGSEIGKTIDKFTSYFELGFKMGKNRIMRELRDIKGSEQEKEDILALGCVAAMADGELEPAEEAVLTEVAREFGLKLENYV
jgi:tellurite resistance protein TerB